MIQIDINKVIKVVCSDIEQLDAQNEGFSGRTIVIEREGETIQICLVGVNLEITK